MFSQTAEYALRAVAWLAQNPGQQPRHQIAEATQVPVDYLAKVMRQLGQAGLVTAGRGLHGGFVLARGADDISILDVINAVDPIRRIHACPLKLQSHRVTLCPLHRRLDEALAHIEQAFRQTHLSDLTADPCDVRPLCEAKMIDTIGLAVAGVAS
ncbi:MAG: RrF2 family transcriptional regulator [Bryobacteraceae bacterium]